MPFHVLVADESLFMRNTISRMIGEVPQLRVCGIAANGKEAIELAAAREPDAIVMNLDLPVVHGLEVLRAIMASRPVPVIMLSTHAKMGDMEAVAALQMGAVDFVAKPASATTPELQMFSDELIEKLKAVAKIPPTQLLKLGRMPQRQGSMVRRVYRRKINQIVAIGTSTGGPQALQELLCSMPEKFPYPVVVAQHMPSPFTAKLADKLNAVSPLRVVEASQSEVLENGTVYIVPGDCRMNVVSSRGVYRVKLSPEKHGRWTRNSVDELFSSVASFPELKKHLVVLTGIGSDGAAAMVRAKRAGACSTIAQSKDTCIVYGMPRAAVEAGGVDYVVPLDGIANKLAQLTSQAALEK